MCQTSSSCHATTRAVLVLHSSAPCPLLLALCFLLTSALPDISPTQARTSAALGGLTGSEPSTGAAWPAGPASPGPQLALPRWRSTLPSPLLLQQDADLLSPATPTRQQPAHGQAQLRASIAAAAGARPQPDDVQPCLLQEPLLPLPPRADIIARPIRALPFSA